MWKRPFGHVAIRNKLLIADVHRAQTTTAIQDMLRECRTALALVPPGTTSLVQPLDVSVNAEFKHFVEELQNKLIHCNVKMYVEGKISASQRRVLITNWVGEAWTKVSSNTEMIQRAFQKCGIAVPIDGSGDIF